MTSVSRGMRRTCAHCQVAFYDFNKETPTCPKCDEVYISPLSLRASRKRSSLAKKDASSSSIRSSDAPFDEDASELHETMHADKDDHDDFHDTLSEDDDDDAKSDLILRDDTDHVME